MRNAEIPSLRKSRGAFFTPTPMAEFLVRWAIRSSSDKVLEPSCGEASFLLAAGNHLRSLGANQLFWSHQLHGVEIHKASADAALALLSRSNLDANIEVRDFFACDPSSQYDAVVGNPPYVRYQKFAGRARAKSLEAALTQGVRLSGLASSWAAFVVHASRFLSPDGRLALVLPAELLTVNYAAEVRRFLLRRFANVRLVMFEERVFPGVLEEVVLLLAEGAGGAKFFEVHQARNIKSLSTIDAANWTEHRPINNEKWTPALLPPDNHAQYRSLSASRGFSPLLNWGRTYLGAVTGNNRYFAISRTEAAKLRLPEDDLVRISPPGSRHLRGLRFTRRAWDSLFLDEAPSLLFCPRKKLSAAANRYISLGEDRGVNKAYKCAVRSPWWQVPLVPVPDLFLTYMNHDRPRLISNESRAHILNSIYGVTLHPEHRKIGRKCLPIACMNSVTLLGAEVVGRAYGGGLLKIEPKEADLLPVPSVSLLEAVAEKLSHLRPQLAVALRRNDLQRAVEMVDRIVLKEELDVSDEVISGLRSARELLFQRRRTRGRANRGKD